VPGVTFICVLGAACWGWDCALVSAVGGDGRVGAGAGAFETACVGFVAVADAFDAACVGFVAAVGVFGAAGVGFVAAAGASGASCGGSATAVGASSIGDCFFGFSGFSTETRLIPSKPLTNSSISASHSSVFDPIMCPRCVF
jgi:hypothetical protein